jgi:RHS repeat-associated protein
MSYDGRNRCVSRTVNGTTTFLFYESWNLIEERDGSGTQTARYVHGARIDELITLTAQPSTLNQTYYYHHDALGSATQATGSGSAVVERYRYDVFGIASVLDAQFATLSVSVIGNRFLFAGREHLIGTQTYDYRNRTFPSQFGRFVQTDPLRFNADDFNLYRYVSNNPVNHSDPLGLMTLEEFIQWYTTFAKCAGASYVIALAARTYATRQVVGAQMLRRYENGYERKQKYFLPELLPLGGWVIEFDATTTGLTEHFEWGAYGQAGFLEEPDNP